MPAAAVIPAPRVYIKVVAVKKLVVELRIYRRGSSRGKPLLNKAPSVDFYVGAFGDSSGLAWGFSRFKVYLE